MPSRPQVEPTDNWRHIALLLREPGQRSYELIRPAVFFEQSPAERTVYRQVARFEQFGIACLVSPSRVEQHRFLPSEVH